MKKIFTFVVLILISFNFNNKAFSIEADVFVQSTVNRAAKTLGGGLTKEERIEKLKEIAKDTVDITGIGFYSLGKHRKNLSKEQLENYKIVFEAYFLKSFSSRLAEYSNPEIEVNSKNIINANYTIVSSTLVATDSRPEVKIEWRVYTKDPDNLLIRDLIIEGLSLARTQKEEFSSIINSNDGKIEALLKNLSDFSAK
ncbi:ABC transporter substrate-binding protein [Candidatus Pelagibacter sp.]|jgi:phospholipid transport system substrate-binding protein|nr:ABC transporter substrate-binding protein [Candidatus Pelagibacter sp.]MDC1002939.1 ABC transporter substrate-binding protein [Candidatus Pelagibacter sp.]